MLERGGVAGVTKKSESGGTTSLDNNKRKSAPVPHPVITAAEKAAAQQRAQVTKAEQERVKAELSKQRAALALEGKALASEVWGVVEGAMLFDEATTISTETLYKRTAEILVRLSSHTSDSACLEVTGQLTAVRKQLLGGASANGFTWAKMESLVVSVAVNKPSMVPFTALSAASDPVHDVMEESGKKVTSLKRIVIRSAWPGVVEHMDKACDTYNQALKVEQQGTQVYEEEVQARSKMIPPPDSGPSEVDVVVAAAAAAAAAAEVQKKKKLEELLTRIKENTRQLTDDINVLGSMVDIDRSVSRGFACVSNCFDEKKMHFNNSPRDVLVVNEGEDDVGDDEGGGGEEFDGSAFWRLVNNTQRILAKAFYGCEKIGQKRKRVKQADDE